MVTFISSTFTFIVVWIAAEMAASCQSRRLRVGEHNTTFQTFCIYEHTLSFFNFKLFVFARRLSNFVSISNFLYFWAYFLSFLHCDFFNIEIANDNNIYDGFSGEAVGQVAGAGRIREAIRFTIHSIWDEQNMKSVIQLKTGLIVFCSNLTET